MAKTTIVCHAINAAYLAASTVKLDATTLDLVGEPGRSTQSYRREYRAPWTLPAYL
jgi:hypothetical protein